VKRESDLHERRNDMIVSRKIAPFLRDIIFLPFFQVSQAWILKEAITAYALHRGRMWSAE
jgi:hypothetical protein